MKMVVNIFSKVVWWESEQCVASAIVVFAQVVPRNLLITNRSSHLPQIWDGLYGPPEEKARETEDETLAHLMDGIREMCSDAEIQDHASEVRRLGRREPPHG